MKKIRKYISLLLFIIGIGCIVYPMIFHLEQGKEIQRLEHSLQMIRQSFDSDESDEIDFWDGVMRLLIPSIQLDQPILPKLSEESLKFALTQLKDDQEIGQGNFTIAGHLSLIEGRHFNALPKTQIGDLVYVIHAGETYTYEIVSKEVVKATQVEVLNDRKGIDEVTLVTCTADGTKRLIVKAERV